MGVVVYVLYKFMSPKFTGMFGNIIVCAVSGAVGVTVYAVLIWVLKVYEIRMLLKKG